MFHGRHGKRKTGLCAVALAVSTCVLGVGYADDGTPSIPDSVAQSVISGNALSQVHGVVNVNMASGDGNAQANAAAIALGMGNGEAAAKVHAVQSGVMSQAAGPGSATASITDNAFANASGLISINQASGAANIQANGIAIALGVKGKVVADSTLAATLSGAGPTAGPGGSSKGTREVSVSNTAFQGASGVIQVNQSAGVGNVTANSFALRVMTGATP